MTLRLLGEEGQQQEPCWTEEFLIDELFLQVAGTKETIRRDDKKCITIHKYYKQAFRLGRWIPIAKPPPEFVVNVSDLEARTVAELSTG